MTSPELSSQPQPQPGSQPASRLSAKILILLALPMAGIIMAVLVMLSNPAQSGTTTDLPNQSINGSAPTLRPPGILNKPAPDFTLTTLDGTPVTLKDYAGRVVFINFWGTWCTPCVKELPALQAFAAQQGNQGAAVLAINSSETPDQIVAFLKEKDITLSSIPVLLDADYSVFQQYGVFNMPTTYVVTPDGILKNVKYGGMTPEDLQAYLAEALGQGAPLPAGQVAG